MSPEKAFEGAKRILASTGHKIFTPSGKYFKVPPAIVAIRPTAPRSAISYEYTKPGW